MKKELRKRLENALVTLKEPGGSTVRSIIKVVNKEIPVLSLRKLLEALQEGINEGFLCMYNGRFKLREQLQNKDNSTIEKEEKEQAARAVVDSDNFSETESEDEDDEEIVNFSTYTGPTTLNKHVNEVVKDIKKNHKSAIKNRDNKNKKRTRFVFKESPKKSKRSKPIKKPQKRENGRIKRSVLELADTDILGNKSNNPPAEKPNIRRQRGPRCTSMKKDVCMPSKVHIPVIAPPMIHRTNNFNDLLRRSPDPFNGPPYDSFLAATDNFAFL